MYVAGFFAFFIAIFVMPELLRLLREMPPGPEQQEMAKQIAKQAAQPRLLYAFGAALGTVALGARLQILPGLRARP